MLAPLALWMHETSPGVGSGEGKGSRRKLEEIYTNRNEADPEQAARQLLADAREYASLLLERGAGEYGFIHLTFQEYLAGIAIAQQGQSDIGPVVDLLGRACGRRQLARSHRCSPLATWASSSNGTRRRARC